MSVEILTKDDLLAFRNLLLGDLRQLLKEAAAGQPEPIEGYKTKHVRRILGCSVNKLVSLRVNRKIRTKKVGGTLYYNKDDVKRLLHEGF